MDWQEIEENIRMVREKMGQGETETASKVIREGAEAMLSVWLDSENQNICDIMKSRPGISDIEPIDDSMLPGEVVKGLDEILVSEEEKMAFSVEK